MPVSIHQHWGNIIQIFMISAASSWIRPAGGNLIIPWLFINHNLLPSLLKWNSRIVSGLPIQFPWLFTGPPNSLLRLTIIWIYYKYTTPASGLEVRLPNPVQGGGAYPISTRTNDSWTFSHRKKRRRYARTLDFEGQMRFCSVWVWLLISCPEGVMCIGWRAEEGGSSLIYFSSLMGFYGFEVAHCDAPATVRQFCNILYL